MGNEILMDDGLLGLQPRAQIGEDLLEQLDGLVGHLLAALQDDLPAVLQPHQLLVLQQMLPPLRHQLALLHVDRLEEPLEAFDARLGEQAGIQLQ